MSRRLAVKTVAPTAPRGRPRNAAAREKVLRAARALLGAAGVGAVTIEAVAAASGVSKPTIYRTWPNAQAVVMAALMQATPVVAPPSARVRALPALRQQLRDIAAALGSRTGRSVTLILAAADAETELSKAFRHHFILERRAEGRRLLDSAAARGEIRAGLDLDLVLDELYGAIFFRIMLGHAPVDERMCERLLDQVMSGAGPR